MNKKRIDYLEKKYSETNIAKGEMLSTSSIKRINQNYYKNQKRRRVDAILNNVKNKSIIKKEVHQIVESTSSLKKLCHNCSEEEIIVIIILYVSKTRIKGYRIDRTKLWKEYNITWQRYGLIISNLLKDTREQK